MLKLNKSCFGLRVQITVSGEAGTVRGFAQHQRTKEAEFYVEYADGEGCARAAWFYRDQLEVISA